MSVAKVIEISSTSKKGFNDAIENGIKRASKTMRGIDAAWVADQEVSVKNGRICASTRCRLRITFMLDE